MMPWGEFLSAMLQITIVCFVMIVVGATITAIVKHMKGTNNED